MRRTLFRIIYLNTQTVMFKYRKLEVLNFHSYYFRQLIYFFFLKKINLQTFWVSWISNIHVIKATLNTCIMFRKLKLFKSMINLILKRCLIVRWHGEGNWNMANFTRAESDLYKLTRFVWSSFGCANQHTVAFFGHVYSIIPWIVDFEVNELLF